MTGQDLLNRMEIANAELQNQPNEQDVSRSLIALNIAQDHFEILLADRAKTFGSTTGTITQTNQTESSAYPAGLLRLDKLQYLDPNTNRPSWDITPLSKVGGHSPSQYWPFNLLVQSAPGKPRAYWTNGLNIYWDPLPDGANVVRWYGFAAAVDITAVGTFAYPDAAATPLAFFAARLMKLSLDDDASQVQSMAEEFMSPVIDVFARFTRDRAPEMEYTRLHDA